MTTSRGRPRGFDRASALEHALAEFWRNGYQATSIAGLTRAMGISAPSLYAAFGDKRTLFSEAVARYAQTYGQYGSRSLAEPTARAAVERMLREAAAEYTDASHPPGCLVINGAVNTTPADEDVKAELQGFRDATKHAIAQKIQVDVRACLLPQETDPLALATFYATVIQGMSIQACDGAGREDLHRVVDLAMKAWPV
ncbi:TetR/AcrR family transcriptional regulator [Streptomyces sp900116325]|uniref:TetR/AcrR family transcriptional regulator n=1 Tax=Streptomyces sp. 900116325 TaxID=3154295 RepID=UPI0033F9DC3A